MSAELGEYDASFRNVTVHGSTLPKPKSSIWKILHSSLKYNQKFDPIKRAKFHVNDEEFTRSHTRLMIKSSGSSNPDSRFPKADTCFFNLELPAYSSKEVLKDRLMFAITNTNSMNADENAGNLHDQGNQPIDDQY
jgi:hypothetical protein